MPITNGDAMLSSSAQLLPGEASLDHSQALAVLQSDYESRDGLDVKQLLDSKRQGGLAYNDFLVLPGYIGMLSSTSHRAGLAWLTLN